MTGELPVRVPALELRGVSRTYAGSDHPAVDGVSLTIQSGEFVAVVGPSGSGKSTLLNVVGLLDAPTGGSILHFGEDLQSAPEVRRDAFRSHTLGFVFQASHVLGEDSALANAALALRVQGMALDSRSEVASTALDFVGLGHRSQLRAKLLSGGERQRLAIARAVATRPRIILADEPTGNLDTRNGERVVNYLRALHSEGTTVVIITHDPEIARAADRRVEIRDGRVVSDISNVGPPEAAPTGAPEGASSPRGWLRRAAGSVADDWCDAVNALSARVLRTVALILAFAMGIGGLTAAIGISSTTSNAINDRLAVASQDTVAMNVDGAKAVLADGLDSLHEGVGRLGSLGHVVSASYLFSVVAADTRITRIAATDPEPGRPLTLHSASPGYLADVGVPVAPAHAVDLLTQPELGPAAIVSATAAQELDIPFHPEEGPPAGASIWVDGILMPVVGVLRPPDASHPLSSAVLVPDASLRGAAHVQLTVRVRTEKGFAAAVAKVASVAYSPSDPGRAIVDTTADIQSLRQGVSSDLRALIGLLSGVLLVLATITASSSMYLTVQSRSVEIALRRAIGSSRWLICRTFILEGIVVGTIAGLIGGVGGALATMVLSFVQGWPPVLPAEAVPAGLMLGMVTGTVSAIVPARMASRKDPALAIRA